MLAKRQIAERSLPYGAELRYGVTQSLASGKGLGSGPPNFSTPRFPAFPLTIITLGARLPSFYAVRKACGNVTSGRVMDARDGGMQVCPKCNHSQFVERTECERCGVIFAKLQASKRDGTGRPRLSNPAIRGASAPPDGWSAQLKSLLFEASHEEVPLLIAGRAIVYLGLLIWGWRFILAPIKSNLVGQSFIHLVNLPFHEAGHVLFGFFGRFVGVLGGSLMQLLVPAVVLCAFIYNRDVFGGAVGLWWLGESALDLAPYIDDARAGQLLLLGGVTGSEVEDYHDWEVILRQLGWLPYDHGIARMVHGLGTVLILLSFAWGGYILYRQIGRAE